MNKDRLVEVNASITMCYCAFISDENKVFNDSIGYLSIKIYLFISSYTVKSDPRQGIDNKCQYLVSHAYNIWLIPTTFFEFLVYREVMDQKLQ